MKDLIAVIMLAGIYGLLSACFFVDMDAVDVAFTEASVGAGISTLLMLVTITMTGRSEHTTRHKPALAFFVVATCSFTLFVESARHEKLEDLRLLEVRVAQVFRRSFLKTFTFLRFEDNLSMKVHKQDHQTKNSDDGTIRVFAVGVPLCAIVGSVLRHC